MEVAITDVILHYRRWPGDGYWCSRITMAFGDRLVHLLLGDAGDEQQLVPSSDNIALLFPPEPLPSWELGDDSANGWCGSVMLGLQHVGSEAANGNLRE